MRMVRFYIRICCLNLLLISSLRILSQPITFSKAIDFDEGYECPISVIAVSDGYLLFGTCSDFQTFGGYRVCKIIKTDTNGVVVWKKLYGKGGTNYYGGAQGSFIKLTNGGYAVALTDIDSIKQNYDACLIRFDENGDTVFVKSFGGYEREESYTVAETSDKGFILIGITYSYGVPTNGKYYVVKTDSLGNLEWQNTYTNASDAKGIIIDKTLDNGYLLGGRGILPGRNYESILIKIDSAGNQKWIKDYGTLGEDCGINAYTTSDSGYIFISCLDTVVNFSNPRGPYYISKVDKNGITEWRKIINYTEHFLLEVKELKNRNGFVVIGYLYDPMWDVNTTIGLLMKLDNDGNLIWERRYSYKLNSIGNKVSSEFNDFKETDDSGYIILGLTFDVNQDFWLLKLDSLGCMDGYCGLTDTNCYYMPYPNCDDTLSVEDLISAVDVKVYPNPATNEIKIQSEKHKIQNITLYDIAGKNVPLAGGHSSVSEGGKGDDTNLNIKELPQGIYFFQVTLSNGTTERAKFIKQ
jgi:hypothetical protein